MPEERTTEALSEVLSEFARTMLTDFPIQAILDHLVRRIVDVLPITAAGVTLISPGREPRHIAASNHAALSFETLQSELDQGPCVAAYQTGEAIAVPDLRLEDRFPAFVSRAIEAGMGAVFTYPLSHGDARPLGALDLYRETPGELSADAMKAAQTLADVAAAYLLNAQARADLQASSDRSRDAALHDSLTGLPNRTLVLERIKHASLRWKRSRRTSAVLFIDLDRFKAVNDVHGHHVGDELLVAIADRLPRVLRPGDTLARISGDEFVVLCEDLADASEADAVVARVADAFARPFALSGVELRVGASIGMAFTGDRVMAANELVREADLAMYKVKRLGRDAPVVFDLGKLHQADRTIEDDLRGAAERGELSLDYQPIVCTEDGRMVGAEALLRWNHPTAGLIPPAVIIPIAERSGLIIEIGRWVLEQAQADRGTWRWSQARTLNLSINVSARQLVSPSFVDTVAAVLATTQTDPALLTLELTESVLVSDPDRARLVLAELKAMGVGLAIDDFGTGYSSLSTLQQYPVDRIKVDSEFVARMGTNPASNTVVAAVLDLAHALGMEVVAEGVETSDQQRQLAKLSCDQCQGFYFGRPVSSGALDALIGRCVESGLRLPVRALSSV